QPEGAPAFEMRVGIHTGAVVAGVVGTRKFAFDIWGQTVNVAQRLEQRCPLNAIQVSAHTLEACGAHSFVASPNGHYTPPDGQPIPTFLIAWR
ncbi:MAG: adenylate/guanylate cyclase domain-containing protein, partial [Bacteroidetes bacterium]